MTKSRQWLTLTGVAVVAVLAAGWFLLISPKHSEAAQLRNDATAQAQANDTLRAQVAALTVQARNLPRERAKLALLSGKIPSKPELPTLILRLREAADRAGVTLVSLRPSPPTAVTATGVGAVPAPAGSAARTGAGQLLTIPISVEVNGGFFQLEQFLANLEDLPRSFLVGQLTVAAGAASSAATAATATAPATLSSGPLTATITGRVFLGSAPAAATRSTTPTAPSVPSAPTAPAGQNG